MSYQPPSITEEKSSTSLGPSDKVFNYEGHGMERHLKLNAGMRGLVFDTETYNVTLDESGLSLSVHEYDQDANCYADNHPARTELKPNSMW